MPILSQELYNYVSNKLERDFQVSKHRLISQRDNELYDRFE